MDNKSTKTAKEISVIIGRTEASVELRRSRLNRGIASSRKAPVFIKRLCEKCGNEFTCKGKESTRFCSRECALSSESWLINTREQARIRKIKFEPLTCLTCGKVFQRTSKSPNQKHCSRRCGNLDYEVSKKRIISTRENPLNIKTTFNSCRHGWIDVGGQRFYSRSKWESNYARYLEFLKNNKEIQAWEHEPKTFWFECIKRGCRSYLPDFRVISKEGIEEFHEVKGWMDPKSITKIKRMKKYHPDVILKVFDSPWYKSNSPLLCKIVPGWEK